MDKGADQRDAAAVRVPHEREAITGAGKDRLEQRDLVAQRDLAVLRPRRAFAGAVGIGGEDMEARAPGGPSARATAPNCSRSSARTPRPGRSLLRGRTAAGDITSPWLPPAARSRRTKDARPAVSYHSLSPRMSRAPVEVRIARLDAERASERELRHVQRAAHVGMRDLALPQIDHARRPIALVPDHAGRALVRRTVQLAQPDREPVHQASRQRLQPARLPSRLARRQARRPACRRAGRARRRSRPTPPVPPRRRAPGRERGPRD